MCDENRSRTALEVKRHTATKIVAFSDSMRPLEDVTKLLNQKKTLL